jgi:hypothetical protein
MNGIEIPNGMRGTGRDGARPVSTIAIATSGSPAWAALSRQGQHVGRNGQSFGHSVPARRNVFPNTYIPSLYGTGAGDETVFYPYFVPNGTGNSNLKILKRTI